MKIAFAILLIIAAILVSGCTSAAPSSSSLTAASTTTTATAPATPNIIGMWNGTFQGYEKDIGYTNYGNAPMSMVVTEQQGRIFSGNFLFMYNNTMLTVPMAGIIGRDGRTFALVEDSNGFTSGEIIGDSVIELSHFDDGKPFSVAIDTLKKV